MSKLNKVAAKDAAKWARAEMFFGEGAGTRRKLLQAEIQTKIDTIPGYYEKFEKSYVGQNMADHAIAAAKERQRLDHTSYLAKNAKALLTGRIHHLSPSFVVIVVGAAILHETGYDKVLLQKGKNVYLNLKADYRRYKAKQRQGQPFETYEVPREGR